MADIKRMKDATHSGEEVKLVEIGKRLKEAREIRGLTLEEVEEETKIRRKYLRALEEEQFQVLPGPAYAKAFLKTYTRFLGIESGDVWESYNRLFPAEEPLEQSDKYPAEEYKPRTARKSRAHQFIKAAAVFTGLAVIIFFVSWVTGRENTPETIPEQTITNEQTVPPSVQQPLAGEQQPAAAPVLTLDLNVKHNRCWMRVSVDGKPAYEGTLVAGESKHFEAKDSVNVRFGDAGAVEALLNGQSLGFMGNTGEVAEREFKALPGG